MIDPIDRYTYSTLVDAVAGIINEEVFCGLNLVFFMSPVTEMETRSALVYCFRLIIEILRRRWIAHKDHAVVKLGGKPNTRSEMLGYRSGSVNGHTLMARRFYNSISSSEWLFPADISDTSTQLSSRAAR